MYFCGLTDRNGWASLVNVNVHSGQTVRLPVDDPYECNLIELADGSYYSALAPHGVQEFVRRMPLRVGVYHGIIGTDDLLQRFLRILSEAIEVYGVRPARFSIMLNDRIATGRKIRHDVSHQALILFSIKNYEYAIKALPRCCLKLKDRGYVDDIGILFVKITHYMSPTPKYSDDSNDVMTATPGSTTTFVRGFELFERPDTLWDSLHDYLGRM